jgi:hypothetical protein
MFFLGSTLGFLAGWLGYRKFGPKGEQILTDVKKL